MQHLPPNTWGVMVHKVYSQRVKEFLYSVDTKGWNVTEETPPYFQCTLLDTPLVTGVSVARRGYVVLLLKNVPGDNFFRLNHLARKNISFVGRLTSCITIDESSIGSVLYNNSTSMSTQDDEPVMNLRVDCHPKTMIEDICYQLQTAARRQGDPAISDPFEGRIPMTMSATKCTHLLTIICCPNTNENDADEAKTCTFYWGMENRSDTPVKLQLNHSAKADSAVVTSNATGIDALQLQATVPLSRAYYKLDQVWDHHLAPLDLQLHTIGAALDLGASPGGWTQVLVHKARFESVVAVDRAILAERVAHLPEVTQLRTSMETANVRGAAPQHYSMLVCDASIIWLDLMDLIVSIAKKCEWTLPACVVLTFKMPFKTIGSVERHIGRIRHAMPSYLPALAAAMYPGDDANVRTRYRLVHLMANADSERTLICLFDKI